MTLCNIRHAESVRWPHKNCPRPACECLDPAGLEHVARNVLQFDRHGHSQFFIDVFLQPYLSCILCYHTFTVIRSFESCFFFKSKDAEHITAKFASNTILTHCQLTCHHCCSTMHVRRCCHSAATEMY